MAKQTITICDSCRQEITQFGYRVSSCSITYDVHAQCLGVQIDDELLGAADGESMTITRFDVVREAA